MTELLGLPYSPWSEKARWALDVRRVPYTSRLYQPLVGEPALRLKLRRFTGAVTVPVLTTDDGRVIGDSAEIARWADQSGDGPRLFPAEHEGAIARFIDLSERALAAGRALSLARMLGDEEALREMVPGSLRRTLGPMAARVGSLGIKRTLRKYGSGASDAEAHRRALRAALDEIRTELARSPAGSGPRTLLGSFTFADVAAAQALAFVEPPATGLKLKASSRRCFRDPDLRERYADIVAWRDGLYEAFRGQKPG
jgi:glutathione S-transferase